MVIKELQLEKCRRNEATDSKENANIFKNIDSFKCLYFDKEELSVYGQAEE
jgi:hypothetical protein